VLRSKQRSEITAHAKIQDKAELHMKTTNAQFYVNTSLSTLCHSDMFRPSGGHLQGLQQIQFSSEVNK